MTNQPTGEDPDDPARTLTHLDERGQARMVDVSQKPTSVRTARALGLVRMAPAVRDAFFGGGLEKGDGPAVARLAGIGGAKETARLIPLCHPLPISGASVEVRPGSGADLIEIEASVRTTGQTGVEMEALTAVSVAALAVYDMVKALQRDVRIESIALIEKTGGTRGDWRAP
ncbi:MAG: cyclic pyranopterin monophosphate synthase MoaC [Planctomycetota bacterium]